MKTNNEYQLFDEETEYLVKLIFSNYEGAINQKYNMLFHCFSSKNQEPKEISIDVSSLVINMWTRVGGNKNVFEDKEAFAWQIVQSYLHKLQDKDVIKIYIHRDDNAQIPEGSLPIKAAPTITETSCLIKFGAKKPSDTQIRREILKICFNEYQNNPHGYLHKAELFKFIPVTKVELERNVKYLDRGGYLDGKMTNTGYALLQITNYGIDVFSDPKEFNRLFQLKLEQTTNNIGGDMIVTNISGIANKNMVKTKDVNKSKKE